MSHSPALPGLVEILSEWVEVPVAIVGADRLETRMWRYLLTEHRDAANWASIAHAVATHFDAYAPFDVAQYTVWLEAEDGPVPLNIVAGSGHGAGHAVGLQVFDEIEEQIMSMFTTEIVHVAASLVPDLASDAREKLHDSIDSLLKESRVRDVDDVVAAVESVIGQLGQDLRSELSQRMLAALPCALVRRGDVLRDEVFVNGLLIHIAALTLRLERLELAAARRALPAREAPHVIEL